MMMITKSHTQKKRNKDKDKNKTTIGGPLPFHFIPVYFRTRNISSSQMNELMNEFKYDRFLLLFFIIYYFRGEHN